MKRKLALTLLTAAITFGMVSSVTAQEQESDVTVNVSDVTQIDVRPSALTYGEGSGDSGIAPGADVAISDEGYEHIDLENIGSVPIEQIHAEATMHQDNPFGDSSANNFNTGNFVTLSTETASNEYSIPGVNGLSNMTYLNRVEYAEENPPEYIFNEETDGDNDGVQLTGGTTAINDIGASRVGRFRVGAAEYFWALYSETSTPSTGTNDDWVLRVGDTPHTPTQLGTVDFRNPDDVDGEVDYTEYNASSQSSSGESGVSRIDSHTLVSFDTSSDQFTGQSLINEGSASSNASDIDSSEARNYNLFVDGDNANGTQIVRTHFNVEQQSPQLSSGNPTYRTSETNSGAQQAIFFANTDGDRLQPGQNFPINIGVQLPNGVDRSRIDTGTVTVVATADSQLGSN
ncbi:hypothetical protein [Candidatus Nanohalobium constans]|uniref:Uncharacterized protein n=1 Tax=Candidatus Nanohalobium constans TaxID=2565781 RepID=A0A5Q0UGL6_9ARCH|nr:hypothetical protein [Candidatus Nanohalobium constans]QGA80129.1 hypothetical protein LC1Nh_0225 [Candidatus Nanohalobium constans]